MSLLPSEPDTEPPDAGPRVIGVDSEDAEDVLAALSSGTARELLSVLHEEPAPPSRLADEVDTSLQNAQYHLEKLETAGAVEVVDTAYSEKGREMDVYAPADQPLVIFAGDEGESTLRSALSRLLGSVGVLAVASLAVQALVGEGGLLDSPTGAGGAGAGGAGAAGGGSGGDGGAAPNGGDAAVAEDAAGATPTPEPATTDGAGGFNAQSIEETTTETPVEAVADTAATAARNVTETVTETVSGTAPPEEVTRTAADGVASLPPGLLFFAGGLVAVGVVAVALSVR
jgi:DNA-binding transcriptional ArsR family regulator